MSNKNLTLNDAFKLAVKNHQNNDLQDAQNYYQQVLELDPNHSETLNNLGVIFLGWGENQKAKDCFEKAIEHKPDYVGALNNLGIIFQRLGENQKAKKCFEKAIEHKPDYVDAHNNLGNIFKDLGEYQKAKYCFEKAIEINPNYAIARNNLGNIFKDLGEYQKAKDCFEKAIEIDPDREAFYSSLSTLYTGKLDELEKSINLSYKALKIYQNNSKFINQSIPLFKLKHDVQQAQYLISKNYKINGIDEFQKVGSEILNRKGNKEIENNSKKKILLT